MKILLSAGPTLEPIDPVRFISNRSSGRMGVAIAKAALKMGDEVQVVHGPLSVPKLEGGTWIPVETTAQMMEALAQRMEWADVLLMSAAICDMRPVQTHESKGDKTELLQLNMIPNPDVVATLAKHFPDCFVVSFSLENNLDLERPIAKMKRKGVKWVVINAILSMGADATAIGVFDAKAKAILPFKDRDKELFAQELLHQLHHQLDGDA